MGVRGTMDEFTVRAFDDPAMALYALDTALLELDRQLDRVLRADGQSNAAVRALSLIAGEGRRGVKQCALGSTLQAPPASLSRLVDHLVRADLVKRSPHPNDRRVTMLEITEAGRAVLDDRRSQYGRLAGLLTSEGLKTAAQLVPLLQAMAKDVGHAAT